MRDDFQRDSHQRVDRHSDGYQGHIREDAIDFDSNRRRRSCFLFQIAAPPQQLPGAFVECREYDDCNDSKAIHKIDGESLQDD